MSRLLTALLLVLAACRGEPATPDAPSTPVLLIVVDTLRADHLGAYGYPRDTSPNIDRLARASIRYDNAVSQAPWTTPSVASLLTSQYPSAIGIQGEHSVLADSLRLLPEVFQQRGFATGAVVSHTFCSSRWNFDQGFDVFDESNIAGHDGISSSGVTDRALDFIEQHADESFFLWLHYFDPHFSYISHDDFAFEADPGYRGPIESGMTIRSLLRQRESLRPEDVARVVDLYDSEIAHTDAQVGRVLDRLRELGLFDTAVVVLTADHGEEFMERGRIGHARTLHQELVRVPLLVKCPGVQPGVVEEPVGLVDVYPTVQSCLEWPLDEGLAGAPLPGTAAGTLHHPVFTETNRRRRLHAVVDGRYKLIEDRDAESHHFYDLVSDPSEREDLGNEGEEFERLRALLVAWRGDVDAVDPAREALDLTAEEVEHLRGLGYVEDPDPRD